jgi:hypothetical protein
MFEKVHATMDFVDGASGQLASGQIRKPEVGGGRSSAFVPAALPHLAASGEICPVLFEECVQLHDCALGSQPARVIDDPDARRELHKFSPVEMADSHGDATD